MELELIRQISQFGLLGVLLALVAWVSTQLWRDLKISWEARISENKHLTSVIEATNKTYSSLATATENRARAQEAVSLAQQETAKLLETQIRALQKVSEGNEGLIRSIDKLMLETERQGEEIDVIKHKMEESCKYRTRPR